MRYELAGFYYSLIDSLWLKFNTPHPTTERQLYDLTKDKSIVIVGNSPSVFKKINPIDDYDVVIRINKGYPMGRENYIGTRTDVLVSAYNLSEKTVRAYYKQTVLFWAFNTEFAHPYWKHNAYLFKAMERWKLQKSLGGAKPSSGIIIIDWLCRHTDFKELHLYGFSFFKDGTWWLKEGEKHPHKGNQEEAWVKRLAKMFPITIHGGEND